LSRAPRSDVALDPDAILALLTEPMGRWAGAAPDVCRAELMKQNNRRLVVRYDLGPNHPALVGKWFSTDRGKTVEDALRVLRAHGFAGPKVAVPAPVAYFPELRALFVEAVDGALLREILSIDQRAAALAGGWLAAFHRSPLHSPRSCGHEKQVRAVHRWTRPADALAASAERLATALDALDDPELPVHYDYYHSQVLMPPDGPTVVVDLDEAGRGDPAFDVAHFEAHLELLALQWSGDPEAFAAACAAFRAGYGSDIPEPAPALYAFAWFKLAHQLLARNAPASESSYALAAVERSLSAA
jgi:aminoglycoside phosphotransferase (APT) family kinase protein